MQTRTGRGVSGLFARRLLVAMGILCLAFGAAARSLAASEITPGAILEPDPQFLDGLTFSGHIGPKGKPAMREDSFVFRNGNFISLSCAEFGFTEGPYWVRRANDGIHFRAELESPDHGTMVYTGRIRGDALEATFAWTKARWYWTIERDFWFKGKLVRKD